MIKLVVGAECGERAGADAVSKEDLSGGVDPGRAIFHVAPVDLEERVKKMQLRSLPFCLSLSTRRRRRLILTLYRARNKCLYVVGKTLLHTDLA